MVILSPKVSIFTVLCQDVCACSLEVQHSAVKAAIMRVAKGNAGGRTREAVRTAQTWDNSWHLILTVDTHTSKFSYIG